jgi:hypothetical protein
LIVVNATKGNIYSKRGFYLEKWDVV